MTRVAIVEPFLGGSHRAWAEGYAGHSSLDVTVVGHAPVHWKWRMQGAHVTLAERLADEAAATGDFDVVVCSDMVDVAGLLGVLRGRAGDPFVALYMHENQLTFPVAPGTAPDLTYAMTNWTSMVAADIVVFNSTYHRDDWFGALPGFLRRFPDERHSRLVDAVRRRSVVLPVGVDAGAIRATPLVRRARPLVLWNHRWQWDKGPDLFVDAIVELAARRDDFEVAIAGDRGGDESGKDELRSKLGDRLVHDGFAEAGEYRRLLRSADVVVSTARHEFFGVGVVEAVTAGACPVLPDRLAYPAWVPVEHRDVCLYGAHDDLATRLDRVLAQRPTTNRVGAELSDVMASSFGWDRLAARYDDVFAGRPGGRR